MNFFRSKLCILLLLLALGASLGACGYRPEPEKTESGQTVFRLGFSETPSTLDPYTAETDAAAAAISLLYDTLFYADIETGRYINSVCQEYTVQPAAADGARLWTLTLRGDVQFHDGTALTALCGDSGNVDGVHPTDFGFASMAQALCDVLERIGCFAPPTDRTAQ